MGDLVAENARLSEELAEADGMLQYGHQLVRRLEKEVEVANQLLGEFRSGSNAGLRRALSKKVLATYYARHPKEPAPDAEALAAIELVIAGKEPPQGKAFALAHRLSWRCHMLGI